eukprot:4584505-Alexandrium_andersonii.AAC.1
MPRRASWQRPPSRLRLLPRRSSTGRRRRRSSPRTCRPSRASASTKATLARRAGRACVRRVFGL